jgi:hypothetical protein
MNGAATLPSFGVPILHHDPEKLQKFSDATVHEIKAPAHLPITLTPFGVIARLDRAIQYSQSVFTGSPGRAGR